MSDIPPNGCRHCGTGQRDHCLIWTEGVGWHPWAEPTNQQRLERMRERAALRRYRAALGAGLSEAEAREDGWPTPTIDQALTADTTPKLRRAARRKLANRDPLGVHRRPLADDDQAAFRELTDQLGQLIAELRGIAETLRQTLAQTAQSNAVPRDRTATGLNTQLRPQSDYKGLGYVQTTAGRFGFARQEEL